MINLDLVYNITQYLRDSLPGEVVFPEERFEINGVVPVRNIMIRNTGGAEREVVEDTTYQIKVKDEVYYNAKKLANEVYILFQSEAKINGRFGLILPAATVGGSIYPSIQVARITAIQRPESLGKDSNGNSEFSMNFQFII